MVVIALSTSSKDGNKDSMNDNEIVPGRNIWMRRTHIKKKKSRKNGEIEALFNDLASLKADELAQLYPRHPEK